MTQTTPQTTQNNAPQNAPQNVLFEEFEVIVSQSGRARLRTRHQPSAEQQAVLDFLEHETGHGVVTATAGSGKSTLLEMSIDHLMNLGFITPERPAAVMAFGKAVVTSLEQRMPLGVDILTFSSLGHRTIEQKLGKCVFDKDKYARLIDAALSTSGLRGNRRHETRRRLTTSVSLAMSHMTDMNFIEDWQRSMDTCEVDLGPDAQGLYALSAAVIQQGLDELTRSKIVSFPDHTYAPYVMDWGLTDPYATILIDEAQDLSPAGFNLLMSAAARQTRILAVGDPNQCLFEYAGADPDSMERLTETLNARRLPLSVSYRCPRRHVALALPYTTAMVAAKTARDGVLKDVSTEQFLDLVTPEALVLCRTNAPLMSVCYRLVRQGRRAHIAGRDAAAPLTRLLDQTAGDAADATAPLPADFTQALQRTEITQRAAVTEQAVRLGQDPEGALLDLHDVAESLLFVLQESGARTLEDLRAAMKELFSSKPGSIRMLTVHAAKGLEADSVFLIAPDLLPHPSAKTLRSRRAEQAVKYVALTRARKALYIVGASQPLVPAELATP